MSENYELTLSDYLEIARRRWLYFLLPFAVVFMISVVVAITLPPTYESRGTIIIETQQIPDSLIKSTITSYADERIQVIKQLVMTRENLLRIARKFDVFGEDVDELTISEQVDLMRGKIHVEMVSSDGRRRNKTSIAFSVGFEHRSPVLAVAVANELVTLFLSENVKTRTERATETTEFLTQAALDLQRKVEHIEGQMAQYKQEHSEALPEHLNLHVKMLERTEGSIASTIREIKAAQDERRFIDIELMAVQAGLAGSGRPMGLSVAQQLAAAEAELARLEARYSSKHPDVRRQAGVVEDLRAALAVEDAASGAGAKLTAQNIDESRAEAKMASIDKRINSLRQQQSRLEERRKELEAIIIRTPQVQRALVSMERDYENTLRKYKEIQAKEMEARLAESLEQDKKAERFTLLEPPIKPDTPIRPDRTKIMAFGLLIGLAVAVGLVGLLEMSDRRIRGSHALFQLFGERPMVVVPYITTGVESQRRNRVIKFVAISGCASVVAALAAIHFLYMPLDIVLIKIIARLG